MIFIKTKINNKLSQVVLSSIIALLINSLIMADQSLSIANEVEASTHFNKLINELSDAPNWNQGGVEEQKLILVCEKIASLKTEDVRAFIVKFIEFNKSKSKNQLFGGEEWRKIYVLNRVCFDLTDNMPIKKLYIKDWLEGGVKQFKTPYDPEELVNGIFPLSLVNDKMILSGKFILMLRNDSPPPVLQEFDFFTKTLQRRHLR
jgi:hypothetical protein